MTDIPSRSALRFGIPSLDDLFGTFSVSHRSYGIPVASTNEQIKLTIIGPAGSGKSILALHLASRYRADAHSRARSRQANSRESFRPPKVIYISTDLTLPKAQGMWSAFALDRPNMRDVPLHRPSSIVRADPIEVTAKDISLRAELKEVNPNEDTGPHSFAQFLLREQEEDGKCQIGFLDLVTHPAGDLWTFTNRLLGSLEPPFRKESGSLGKAEDEELHPDQTLIIVDNVDGFETHVGELNTFGEPSSVRARIVQAVQASRGKAHLVFLAEESGQGSHPLEDVSDVVIRLRIREERGYRYRAVEIEKARAQAIHRGDHYLLLRTGTGSTTALQENADDPRATNAYIQVIPSLHTVGRRIMNESSDLRLHAPLSNVEKEQRAGFGLRFLDELCGKTSPRDGPLQYDALGLEHSTLTAVVGDTNTYKTSLGHKFLRRSFELFAQNLSDLFNEWRKGSDINESQKIRKVINAIQGTNQRPVRAAGDPRPLTSVEFLALFTRATVEKQAAFLAKLLLQEQAGVEEWWIPQKVETMLKHIHRKVDPRVTVACGRWALRLLTNRLRSHIHDEQTKRRNLKPFREACLPHSKAFSDLYNKFFDDRAKITRQDFLQAAVERWVEGRGHKELPPILRQWATETSYREKGSRSLDLGRVIADCEPDHPKSSPQDYKEVKRAIETEWKRLSTFDFLHAQYRGSTGFLLDEDLRQLRGEMGESEDSKEEGAADYKTGFPAEFSSGLLVRIFVGCALRWIDYQAEQPPEALYKWLAKISPLKLLALGLIPDQRANEKPLTLLVMAKSMWEAITSLAAAPDKKAAMDLALRYLSPEKESPPDIKDTVLKIPGIIDDKLYSRRAITAERFAEWLFHLSPLTHPFGARHGQEALADEIRQLLNKKPTEAPVLCSVLVAAVLQLIRLRQLRISDRIRMDDELRNRPKATGNIRQLHSWLTYIDEVPGASSTKCKQPIKEFVEQVAGSRLTQANLHSLVKAITEVCGAYVTPSNLRNNEKDEQRLRICQLILEEAGRAGLTDGPSILITANTQGFNEIRKQFNVWLGRFACNQRYDAETYKLFIAAASDHLQKWLIVRRLEVHFLPTATLSAIIRANVELAESLLKSRTSPAEQEKRLKSSAHQPAFSRRGSTIRLVIDGLASLKQTYPNIFSDSLFLPSLKLFADREHLSVLVIATQKGRPDMAGADAFERETLNFFPNQIRTWWIEFFGELRVAISVLPPAPARGSSTIRELAVDPENELEVFPHFELYKGIESGEPRPVSLEVRFIVDNPAMQAYQTLLSQTFSGVFPKYLGQKENGRSPGTRPDDYGTQYLRDFGRLHGETHLDQTLVIQLKEFWAFQRSQALHCQSKYLLEEFTDELGHQASDPLQIFNPTMADRESAGLRRRFESFLWNGYFRRSASTHISQREQDGIDRVPFTWDFGFLLCNREAWKVAEKDDLTIAQQSYPQKPTVGHVWASLPKIIFGDLEPPRNPPVDSQQLRSWRFFAEAVVLAARHGLGTVRHSSALDVPVETGDMLTCLLLEIWASEVYQKFFKRKETNPLVEVYFDRFTKRSWLTSQTQGLIGLIAEPIVGGTLQQIFAKALGQGRLPALNRHSMDLFKTILLLCEMLDITKLVQPEPPFNLIPHSVTPEAICSRHWYATACQFLTDNPSADAFIPVRLPGHFSVRGDTYLAIARGSHSSLLGERALDLLSSRRGNDERLRAGIGLPVRRLRDREGRADPRTALRCLDQDGRRNAIRYSNLIRLGGQEGGPDGSTVPADREFKWLWRSTLGDYDAQSREFQRGMTNILRWWNELRTARNADWKSGFHLYDAIDRYYATSNPATRRQIFDENFAVCSLWEFPALCDELVDRLRRATPRQ